MQEFVTAVNRAAEDDLEEVQPLEFKVDGKTCRAFFPGDGQLGMLLAMIERHHSTAEKVAAAINFFVEILDDESYEYLVQKLLSRKDKFGLTEVTDICRWLVKEWTGRPTKASTGSTSMQKRTGRKSTQRTPALT